MKIKDSKEENTSYDFEEFFVYTTLCNYVDCVDLYGEEAIEAMLYEIRKSKKSIEVLQ